MMRPTVRSKISYWALGGITGLLAYGCGDNVPTPGDGQNDLSALMNDGDASAMAPPRMMPPPPAPLPNRYCPSGDCARDPLAHWRFDDCNTLSTELADTAFTSSISHPAFRAVSVACTEGMDNQAVKLAGADDVVYAPDQVDFAFGQGLTVAAWIKPDGITGTQSIVRKRLDGSSSFLLAIDGKKLIFALRLTNGQAVSVSASVTAKRFTHVAATYDGEDAILYLDGAVAAQTHVTGMIAPGAGPILFGNDANGRQFKGTMDGVWLNTVAAPADVVRGLLCVRKPPVVSLTPGETPPQVSGATVPFDLSVTNASGSFCPVDTFAFISNVFYPLTSSDFFGELSVAPGQTAHATVQVASVNDAPIGAFPFQYVVYNEADFQFSGWATASYVVGSRPVSMGIPLLADANGRYDGSNAAGVVGYWWSTGDDYALDATAGAGTCRAAGFPASDCSVLSTPTPGLPFQPDPSGRGMCTSGVAAQVKNDASGAPAYSSIWGDIIGFELNNPGALSDGLTFRSQYDAVAHGVTGFAFDIDAIPMGGHLRVAFQTLGTENNAAYWQGAMADLSPLFRPGHYEIRWPEVGGPFYLPNPPAFAPTLLESVMFHVVSNTGAPVPFNFCISNVMLLTN
jgi:hypothetical protein